MWCNFDVLVGQLAYSVTFILSPARGAMNAMDGWMNLEFGCNLKLERRGLFTPQPRMGLRKPKNFVPRILSRTAHAKTSQVYLC